MSHVNQVNTALSKQAPAQGCQSNPLTVWPCGPPRTLTGREYNVTSSKFPYYIVISPAGLTSQIRGMRPRSSSYKHVTLTTTAHIPVYSRTQYITINTYKTNRMSENFQLS